MRILDFLSFNGKIVFVSSDEYTLEVLFAGYYIRFWVFNKYHRRFPHCKSSIFYSTSTIFILSIGIIILSIGIFIIKECYRSNIASQFKLSTRCHCTKDLFRTYKTFSLRPRMLDLREQYLFLFGLGRIEVSRNWIQLLKMKFVS